MVVSFPDESTLQLTVDASLYSIELIHKCVYWYSGRYEIDISAENQAYRITLSHIVAEENKDVLIRKIKMDLIDFRTREIIAKETRNIRDILIAKAFAHDDTFDEDPIGDVNDSLGFDPTII